MITMANDNRAAAYLEVFRKVTMLITKVLDPQQVMNLVVRTLPELMEVDAVTIRLLDSSTNTFVLGAAHGLSDEYLSRGVIDSREAMEMIMQGRPVAKCDLDADPFTPHGTIAAREGIKSVLSLPILFQEHIIGVMRLLTKRSRCFTEAEISFSMTLAEQIGVAISNGRLFSEMENQVDFLGEVHAISRLVNSTLDLNQILQTIVERLPKILGMKACTIRLLQPETNKLELVAASGLSEDYLRRGGIRKEDSIFMALQGEPVSVFDAPNDRRVHYHDAIRREGIKSILAVPIKKGSEVIGVLRLLTCEHHCFTSSEVTFATAVAEESGSAIQNALTYKKITLLFNQIEENEHFLQNILDSLWDRILVIDRNYHVVMANRTFLRQGNFDESEVLGRPYKAVSGWRDDAAGAEVEQVLTRGNRVIREACLASGETSQWLERTISPIVGQHGAVEYAIETVRDITSQKALERERLEREKLTGVLEMAGTAAHELNSPLFAALGTAQLLRDDLHDAEQRQEMDTIIRSLKTISQLTGKMTSMTGFVSKQYVGDTNILDFL